MSDYAKAAETIATIPSATLAANLEACARTVRTFYESEQMQPRRADMRKRLERVREAAAVLTAELGDPLTLHYLDPSWQLSDDTGALLADIEARAEVAADAIPTGGGKGKAVVGQVSVTARELAALVILMAWEAVRGSQPGPDNRAALDDMAAFWLLSTGRHDSGWRDHLLAAKEIAGAEDERRQVVADIRMMLRRIPLLDLSGQNRAD